MVDDLFSFSWYNLFSEGGGHDYMEDGVMRSRANIYNKDPDVKITPGKHQEVIAWDSDLCKRHPIIPLSEVLKKITDLDGKGEATSRFAVSASENQSHATLLPRHERLEYEQMWRYIKKVKKEVHLQNLTLKKLRKDEVNLHGLRVTSLTS